MQLESGVDKQHGDNDNYQLQPSQLSRGWVSLNCVSLTSVLNINVIRFYPLLKLASVKISFLLHYLTNYFMIFKSYPLTELTAQSGLITFLPFLLARFKTSLLLHYLTNYFIIFPLYPPTELTAHSGLITFLSFRLARFKHMGGLLS